MKIGELARQTGLATSRIRFYEKSGLIRGVERRGNGYRDYGPDAVWKLEIVTIAQSAGFSLDEIRSLLPDEGEVWRHGAMLASLQRKVGEIDHLMARLAQNKARLLLAIDSLQQRPEDLACVERPEWVLGRIRGAQPASPDSD